MHQIAELATHDIRFVMCADGFGDLGREAPKPGQHLARIGMRVAEDLSFCVD